MGFGTHEIFTFLLNFEMQKLVQYLNREMFLLQNFIYGYVDVNYLGTWELAMSSAAEGYEI
jgi:hypothetical protein